MISTKILTSHGGTIQDGRQLISQLAGVGTNVGPNALLQSSSYPQVSDPPTNGLLTVAPLPTGFNNWRIDGETPGTGQNTLPNLWTSRSAAYVYNNNPSNHGGIVPTGGMYIDGYFIPAGTYVFQFLDLSLGSIGAYGGGPSFLLRGCRFRRSINAPGMINVGNNTLFTNAVYLHFCDIGAQGSADSQINEVAIKALGNIAGFRAYRNYVSYVGTGIQPSLGMSSGFNDMIENYIEKITQSYGLTPPPGETTPEHNNGHTMNGNNPNCLILRNYIVTANHDEAGHALGETDCISFFQDGSPAGTFPGTGTNSDGSTGYWIVGNYVGGTGYCMYLGQNAGSQAGTVSNLHLINNYVTTSSFANGGQFGPVANQPPWGQFGNVKSGNTWADGPNVGQTF